MKGKEKNTFVRVYVFFLQVRLKRKAISGYDVTPPNGSNAPSHCENQLVYLTLLDSFEILL